MRTLNPSLPVLMTLNSKQSFMTGSSPLPTGRQAQLDGPTFLEMAPELGFQSPFHTKKVQIQGVGGR